MPIIVWHGGDPGSPNAGNAFGTAALARLEQFRQEDNANQQREDAYAQANQLNDADNAASMERANFAEQGRDRRAQAASTERYTRDNENRASKEHLAATANDARLELASQKNDWSMSALAERLGFTGKQNDLNRGSREKIAGATNELGQDRLGETTRANQAREAQAAKNAEALRGDRANRGATKMSIPDKADFDRLSTRYKELMKQGDEAKTPDLAAMAYAGANNALDSMMSITSKYATNATPSAQPPAQQPPAQQPADVDPNAIHAAAVRLASENPTWTREQIKAAIQAMMGNR